MRQSNLSKYNQCLMLLTMRCDEFINAFFKDKDRPNSVWCPRGILAPEEWQVDEIYYRSGFYRIDKPTNKDVDRITSALASIVFSEDEIMIGISHDRTSAANSWTKLISQEPPFLTLAEAEAHHQAWTAKYGAREGHSACGYCGAQTPIDSLISREIFLYGGRKETRRFCSGQQCAMHEQFAQEGWP